MKYGINNFKNINLSFLQTSGSKLCRLHQRLLKSTKEAMTVKESILSIGGLLWSFEKGTKLTP